VQPVQHQLASRIDPVWVRDLKLALDHV
jgi:hypothetical protein